MAAPFHDYDALPTASHAPSWRQELPVIGVVLGFLVLLEILARSGRAISPELTAAIRDHARVHAECQQKMLEHLYQTADLLDDKQAARYLETMVPHALDSTTGFAAGPHHH